MIEVDRSTSRSPSGVESVFNGISTSNILDDHQTINRSSILADLASWLYNNWDDRSRQIHFQKSEWSGISLQWNLHLKYTRWPSNNQPQLHIGWSCQLTLQQLGWSKGPIELLNSFLYSIGSQMTYPIHFSRISIKRFINSWKKPEFLTLLLNEMPDYYKAISFKKFKWTGISLQWDLHLKYTRWPSNNQPQLYIGWSCQLTLQQLGWSKGPIELLNSILYSIGSQMTYPIHFVKYQSNDSSIPEKNRSS